jgi:hypothetical protein
VTQSVAKVKWCQWWKKEICVWNTSGIIMVGGKLQYSEKNLFQFQFVHYKFQMDWAGTEPRPPH